MPPDYTEYLKKRLSIVERSTSALFSLDERVDYTNLLLTKTNESLVALTTLINNAISKLTEVSDTIEVHQLILSAASTGQQFPVLLMQWNQSVVIKALSGNGGTIYIAGSKQDAEDTARSYPLAAGETIEYKINDLSALWAAASVVGEGLIWTTEAEVG